MAVLELSGVSKHFGAIQALTDVSLSLRAGEVVGLMGDNGAGKSTLVKIVAGNFRPSHGEIRFEGEAVHFHRPIDARAVGIESAYSMVDLVGEEASFRDPAGSLAALAERTARTWSH